MLSAIQVSKSQTVDTKFDIVKLQYLLYCHFNKIKISSAELDTLTKIAISGYTDSTVDAIVRDGIFTSKQSIRNCFTKLTKLNLLSYVHGKRVVNPSIKVGIADAVLLDYKILYKGEPKEAKELLPNNSQPA